MKAFGDAVRRFNRLLGNMEQLFCGAAILILIGTVTIGIVARYVVGRPLSWTNDLAMFFYVWLSFIAASLVMRTEGHYKIALVYDMLPPVVRTIVYVLTEVGKLVFLYVFITASFRVLPRQFNMQETVSLRISKAAHTLAVTSGFVLLAIQGVSGLLLRFVDTRINKTQENEA